MKVCDYVPIECEVLINICSVILIIIFLVAAGSQSKSYELCQAVVPCDAESYKNFPFSIKILF